MIPRDADRDDSHPVGRAQAPSRRAIDRLVDRLGDDDPDIASDAAAALRALDAPAVFGPLVAGLGRARTPRQRRAIARPLATVAGVDRATAVQAFDRALVSETDRVTVAILRAFRGLARDGGLEDRHG
jgi:HEAT repeat protein